MLAKTFKCAHCGKLFSQDIPCYMHESDCCKNPRNNSSVLKGTKMSKKVVNEKMNVPNSLIEKKSSYKPSALCG